MQHRYNLRLLLIISIPLLLAFQLFTSPFLEKIEQRLQEFYATRSFEKVYVQTDKLQYTSGDTIWLKTYLIDGQTHKPNTISKVVYIDLLNEKEKIIQQQKLYIDKGGAAGNIALEKDLPQGEYLLRAYTSHQLNFAPEYIYQQSIPIYYQEAKELATDVNLTSSFSESPIKPNTLNSSYHPDVQFMPEGGDLVEGISSMIALKIIDPNTGLGINLTGRIEDEAGNRVAIIQTLQFGMGLFPFTPKVNQTYTAIIEINGIEQSYPFPKAKPQGTVLAVHPKKEAISIKVVTNNPTSLLGYSVVAHTRGEYLFGYEVTEKKNVLKIDLPTENLPSGILNLTVFNSEGLPIAERLIFIDNIKDKQITLNTGLNKTIFKKREQVDLAFDFASSLPENYTNLSVAVVSQDARVHAESLDNIRSWMLINSDLKGKIEHPDYYFMDTNDNSRKKLLDILLLAQGWKRFEWTDVLKEKLDDFIAEYPQEEGLFLTGSTTYLMRYRTPVEANLFITFMPSFSTESFKSDKEGKFSYGPFLANDTINIILQARVDTKRSVKRKKEGSDGMLAGRTNVNINVLETETPDIKRWQVLPSITEQTKVQRIQAFLQTNQKAKVADRNYDLQVINLAGVEVTSKKKPLTPIERLNSRYSIPNNRVIVDSIAGGATSLNSIFDLLRRVPGVTVLLPSAGGFQYSARIRGVSSINSSTTPLYILDGIPIDEGTANDLDVNDVYNVDVLKGANATIYGSRGANGVILIYTRREVGADPLNTQSGGIANIPFIGFNTAQEFYSPNYNKKIPAHQKPDFRSTLYWNPNLFLTSNNSLNLSFFIGDRSGNYEIITEGITGNGAIIHQKRTFKVE